MAAMVSRVARRSFGAARCCQSSPTRVSHCMSRMESQAAAPNMRSASPCPEFYSSNGGVGCLFSRSRRSSLPRIACAQSLLPLHSAMSAARLVSRLSTSSLSSPLLQGSWLSEDI